MWIAFFRLLSCKWLNYTMRRIEIMMDAIIASTQKTSIKHHLLKHSAHAGELHRGWALWFSIFIIARSVHDWPLFRPFAFSFSWMIDLIIWTRLQLGGNRLSISAFVVRVEAKEGLGFVRRSLVSWLPCDTTRKTVSDRNYCLYLAMTRLFLLSFVVVMQFRSLSKRKQANKSRKAFLSNNLFGIIIVIKSEVSLVWRGLNDRLAWPEKMSRERATILLFSSQLVDLRSARACEILKFWSVLCCHWHCSRKVLITGRSKHFSKEDFTQLTIHEIIFYFLLTSKCFFPVFIQ